MGTQQFCLRWNNHQTNLLAVFDQLLQNEAFVDVTLACEGLSIKAHKMVLSACSPYFQSLFLDNPCQHPIVILKDVRFSELKAVVDFMYKGEVNVSQDQLSALLKTAETLKVKGLAEVTGSSPSGGDVTRSALGIGPLNQGGGTAATSSDGRLSPPPKRKRGRPSKRPSTDGDLEVVESLVDVVPDGPDSVPTPQDRSVDANPSIKSEMMGDGQTDQSVNPSSDMTFDGLPQEHTSNSRDSGTMLADQAQTSSSLGQLPATASTSGMSPGQGTRSWSTQQSYKMWTKEAMFTALKAVFARRMTYQQACDHFSIPVPTFYYYMSRVRKVLKPLEKEEYDAGTDASYYSPDQVSIKGRHGKRLNIAENDLNAAILSVVCRSGKLIVPSDTESTPTVPRSTNFSPTSPVGEESYSLSCSQGDMDFMNRMNVKPRGRQRSWKQEDMYNAIKAILTHQMSLAKASRQFGIPYPTLKVYLKKVSGMSKPPEWTDTETPPPGWTPPQNTWPYQGTSITSNVEMDESQKMDAYDRKLDISEVYSESTSDSSQDDVDEDEDPVGPPINSAPALPKPIENNKPTTTNEVPQPPCSMPIKAEITPEQQPAEQTEDVSENESMDEDENEARENDGHEPPNGAEEIDKPATQQVSNSHENEEEEHDNRPPWIEVLTLD